MGPAVVEPIFKLETQGKETGRMKAVTLLYHDVVENQDYDSSGFSGAGADVYKFELADIKRHFEAVKSVVADNPVTVYDLLNHQNSNQPRFLLTFDDGGVSAASHLADLLEGFGWIGHFLITTDFIGTPTFVNAEQIREIRKRGHIIGTHSCSHPSRMSHCGWDELIDEWGRSVGVLSDILGEPVDTASVPGGYFSKQVARAASKCGIKALFTSEPVKNVYRVDNCTVIGRYSLLGNMLPSVSAGLSSDNLTATQFKQYLYWNVKKTAKTLGGTYYNTMRRSLLRARG